MNLLKNVQFADIIDINTLRDIQNKLAKLINFPTITVDINGIPVCEENNFTPFCRLIRSSPEGRKKCILCDSQAGFIAMREKKPRHYNCHTGLIDCVAPIIVNDLYLGSVLGGQVLVRGEKDINSLDLEKISKECNIPLKKLKEIAKTIPIVDSQYVEDCVSFYRLLANYIAHLGMVRLTQEQLLKESKEKIKLEQQAKKAQIKTIKAQVNPHFLFNTLNTIARMALIEDAPKTEELIYNLSDLLRYNLRNLEVLPKIKDEMENIERYLFIQSLRYSDRIFYKINIDKEVLDFRIPTMTLQPIVENCLVHGLETKVDGGTIEITGKLTGHNDLIIKVSDNGKGIDSAVLRILNNLDNLDKDIFGIGIQNTHNRIRHYFGENYGLKIESQLNIGTTVYIKIPQIK